MKIALFGSGKMGQAIKAVCSAQQHQIVPKERLDQAEICIDFTHPDAVFNTLKKCLMAKKPLVIGTTGWEEKLDEAQALVDKHQGAVLFAPNFSLGVFVFSKLAQKANGWLPTYQRRIEETHHINKKDAPSGTAKRLASLLDYKGEIKSHREADVIGDHTLTFASENETITISHQAHNRQIFAQGAVDAAQWLIGRKGWHTLDELFKDI